MPVNTEIERAIERVRDGDADAFEVVVTTWEWPLRSWLASRCPSAVEADDIAQRAFVEAFRNIARYQTGTDFRAWLWAIARAQLMGEATRVRRIEDYRRRMLPEVLHQAEERRCATDNPADGARLDALRGCMRALPDQHQQLLDLRYNDDLDLTAIAQRVDRSVGALKKAFFKIRRQLSDCIDKRLANASERSHV